ncbi:MAG: hypothetical protein GF393_09745 [Armatimonadia bacterium]|nr:hypothetical protein [Armatimonadia bacterium]
MLIRKIAVLSLLTLLVPVTCHAWGVKGHTWTVDNAVQVLPEGPLKTFMADQRSWVGFNSLKPDFHLKDGTAGELEKPEHYIDLEVIADPPTAEDIPRSREAAMRLYNDRGIAFSNGGFLPWRIQDMYLSLVNAMRAEDSRDVTFYAGMLSHYAADATMPLHTTVDYDGLTDRREDGRKFLQGIHAEYEITFIGDYNIEWRESSLAVAKPACALDSVLDEAIAEILHAHSKVDRLYEVAEAHQESDLNARYAAWEAELGPLTREQLGRASTFIASLWLTAWEEAGRPDLTG